MTMSIRHAGAFASASWDHTSATLRNVSEKDVLECGQKDKKSKKDITLCLLLLCCILLLHFE